MRVFDGRTELKWENTSPFKTEVRGPLADPKEGIYSEPETAKEVPLKLIKRDEEGQRKPWMVPQPPVMRQTIDERRIRRFNRKVVMAAAMGLVLWIGWLFVALWLLQK